MEQSMSGNTAQRENWEQQHGARWVRLADAMERRLAPVNDILLAHARPAPGERVLEVGCGTGATAVALAQAVRPGGSVVGVDISATMLDLARAKAIPGVTLVHADAQEHRFVPPPFDLVASRFGVMFFSDPPAAFANLRRAMRPGGRLAFVCWAPMAENPHWQIPFSIAIRHVGAPEPADPRAPGPMAFSDEAYVREILDAAGFGATAIARERFTFPSGAEEDVTLAATMGPTGTLLDAVDAPQPVRDAITDEIAQAFRPYRESGVPATIFAVTASA